MEEEDDEDDLEEDYADDGTSKQDMSQRMGTTQNYPSVNQSKSRSFIVTIDEHDPNIQNKTNFRSKVSNTQLNQYEQNGYQTANQFNIQNKALQLANQTAGSNFHIAYK